jgi:2-keto-3-deoxy-L-rhamnonate aldolase RhmA
VGRPLRPVGLARHPGEFTNPKFIKAIDTVVAACRKHKKALGRLVPNVETGIDFYKWGFDFICYSGDVWVCRMR